MDTMSLSWGRSASLPRHSRCSSQPVSKTDLFPLGAIAGDDLVAAPAAKSALGLELAFDTNIASTLSDVLVVSRYEIGRRIQRRYPSDSKRMAYGGFEVFN